ncbi:MAG: hypothetical protein ACU83V_07020, partial [Gammaproteobacteria bacterium]
ITFWILMGCSSGDGYQFRFSHWEAIRIEVSSAPWPLLPVLNPSVVRKNTADLVKGCFRGLSWDGAFKKAKQGKKNIKIRS